MERSTNWRGMLVEASIAVAFVIAVFAIGGWFLPGTPLTDRPYTIIGIASGSVLFVGWRRLQSR